MSTHELAGKPAPQEILTNIPALMRDYYALQPDSAIPAQRVAFGTSGHRGSSAGSTFNEAHILAMSQAICDYRREMGTQDPLFLGKDTHALSEAAFTTAVEVLTANGVELRVQSDGYTPTPVISHAILAYNATHASGMADGIVITPSHNPPEDGGFKYNPSHGGPADIDVTSAIAERANAYLATGLAGVKRMTYARGLAADSTREYDFATPYVEELQQVVDMEAIRGAGLRIGADAMGGAGLAYYGRIAERYGIDIDVLHAVPDPTFSFMCVDSDGKIRMDCSSPDAMAGLIGYKDKYDIAFGNDPDFDRHGIVAPSCGLMNPNHYLAVAIRYLFQHRADWSPEAAIGKTLVSSSMIDRVAERIGRRVVEVPVGFKWFVPGLLAGTLGFGGEESAGASFLRRNGRTWTTDKDGMLLAMLAAEITAVTGRDPGEHYHDLEAELGRPIYARIDIPADAAVQQRLKALSPDVIKAQMLGGDHITERLVAAPGNGAAIGGLKVVTRNGWFAARPSGTEPKYKIYAESFVGVDHLLQIQHEARDIVDAVLTSGG